MAKSKIPLENRFWNKVDKTSVDRCWAWKGATNKGGYGRVTVPATLGKYISLTAHRVSWEIHNGSIPQGLCVLHRCDNPPCVNPEHLFVGTRKDNAIDMFKKGRRYTPRGECLSKLTEIQVKEIRQRFSGAERPAKRALAREYGVDHSTIRSLLRGDTWKHLL